MSLPSGTRIGVFEVAAKIGEGGMGEVYRARDTRLDRDVALKVLPALFTSDPERLARFEREAKVLASLNHPNIAQVYGFESPSTGSEHGSAIAMELVDGDTLGDLLRVPDAGGHSPEVKGLPLDRALAIMRQVAAALEAAHDQGIIHRDLKPANVKVREDGTVKVLDFGLAKAFAADAESAASGVSNSPTLTARSTQLGMILGTAAYMAPEQAKGRAVDRRADVWAFGVVFFEVLAGRRAFEGDDVSDVLASVLKTEPDWRALPADLPPPVRRLLRRCLEKDPKKRLRDVAEGMLQLDEGLASGSMSSMMTPVATTSDAGATASAPPRPMWRRALPIVATAAVTALAVMAISSWRLAPPPAAPPARFLFSPPAAAAVFSTAALSDIAISGTGRTIAYVSGATATSLMVRPLDQLDAVPLRGAESAVGPFFSADEQWVGFLEQADQSQIKKVSVLGGPAVSITKAAANVQGATWTSDGEIVFGVSREGPLYHVAEAGGEAVPLTTLDSASGETSHRWPSAVPGTSVVLFVAVKGNAATAINGELAALNTKTGATVRFKLAGLQPRYASSGHIVFATVDGSLRAVPFDPARLAVSGNPVPVLEGVGVKPSGAANFDLSANGHLVYFGGGAAGVARTVVWVDRAGRETPTTAPPRTYFYARVSPDSARISLDVRDQEQDIWVWDVKRETLSRLTDKPGADQYALWTPDRRVVFTSTSNDGKLELFQHRPDGVGQPVQITDTTAEKVQPYPNAITPDGKQVIFRASAGGRKNDLFLADLAGDKKVRVLLSTEHDELNAALSPDGAFMAFESDLSGSRLDIFVRPFPNVEGLQTKVSIAGGAEPVWAPKGYELFYLADNKLMAVTATVSPSRGIELGKPAALFDTTPYFFGGIGRNYDIAPDGKRFVMVKNPAGEQGRSLPITIVLNWAEELRARVK